MTKRRSFTTSVAAFLPKVPKVSVRTRKAPEIDSRPPEPIDPAYLAAIQEGLDQISRGEYAADEDVEAVYRSVGL